jgi:DUF3014 family protein
MPQDLDDYDIRRDYDPQLDLLNAPPPRRHGGLLLGVLGFLVAVGLGVGLYLWRPWDKRPGGTAAAPAGPSSAGHANAPAGPGLPSLEQSDAFARDLAATLSSHPELTRWLARSSLIRTLTAVVDDVVNGESPRLVLDFLAPKDRFRAAAGRSKRVVADPASFAAYDTFGDVIASIDATAAARAYSAAEPLFDAAYRELGHTGAFRPALDQAIEILLAVPAVPADAELVAHTAGFRWADPKLEALSPPQKQLLRMGPRNVRLVQSKLRELQTALARGRGAAP